MKKDWFWVTALVVLVFVGYNPTMTPPAVAKKFSAGQFKNENGVVTGDISEIGLKLEVRGLEANGVSTKQKIDFKSTPTGENAITEHWEISAGEVQIILDRAGNGPIALKVDNQDFGTIQEGVKLLIDEKRQVFIDGAKRESTK